MFSTCLGLIDISNLHIFHFSFKEWHYIHFINSADYLHILNLVYKKCFICF